MSNVRLFRDKMAGETWIFKQEDPNNPAWCVEALSVIQAGARLLQAVRQNPTAPAIAWALHLLEERYWRAYAHADPEHRRDEGHADHPCIHRAWREMRWAIQDLELDAATAELLSPLLLPTQEPRVIEGTVVEPSPEPSLKDVKDVILGTYVRPDADQEDSS
ncbi:hypothetical protein [Geodermatophilus sp. URMC 65]